MPSLASSSARLRAAAVAAVLLLYLLFKLLGGSPGDDAIKVVPGDAYLYLHVDLDSGSDQYGAARKLAERFPHFPLLVQTVLDRLAGGSGQRIDFGRDVRPWLGGEAAFALVPARGARAESMILVETGDSGRANKFFERVAGRPARSNYRGTELRRYGTSDLVTAYTGGFLTIGQELPVKRAIDTVAGGVPSLADDPVAKRARGPLPDQRIADAYASRDGVTRLLARQSGLIGQLGGVLRHPALSGVGAALVASGSGVDLTIRSSLDPERNRRRQGFGAFPAFHPSLVGEAPENTLVYYGISDLQTTFLRLVAEARATIPGLAGGIDRFLRDVRRRGRVDVIKQVLPLLRGEAGLSISPARPAPILTTVVDGIDEKKATGVLARLQGPVARAVNPRRTRQAATFEQRKIDGVDAFSIRLSPTVNLTYAIFDGKLVVSTDPRGIHQVKNGKGSLRDSKVYGRTLGRLPDRVSSVLFLNLDQLLAIGERTGLAEDPAYASIRDDLRRLKALGASSSNGDDHSERRLSLAIP